MLPRSRFQAQTARHTAWQRLRVAPSRFRLHPLPLYGGCRRRIRYQCVSTNHHYCLSRFRPHCFDHCEFKQHYIGTVRHSYGNGNQGGLGPRDRIERHFLHTALFRRSHHCISKFSTTTYTATATNSSSGTSAQTTVASNTPANPTVSISAQNSSISSGSSDTLSRDRNKREPR